MMEHLLVWRHHRWIGRLRRYGGDSLLFAQSASLLALTRLALFVIPFHRLLRISSRPALNKPSRDPTDGADVNARIQKAVVRASRYLPGVRHCLTQALVIQFLQARRGHAVELRIGVAKDTDGSLKAHAWLESNGSPIFGVPHGGLEEYRQLPYLYRTLTK